MLLSHRDNRSNNVYADPKPSNSLPRLDPHKKQTISTQTYLREILALEDPNHSDLEIVLEDEDMGINPDYARDLIDVVIGGLADSEAHLNSLRGSRSRRLAANRLQEIPDFELTDIMGEFEIDDMGNFIIIRGEGSRLMDREDQRVNRRGYLIDRYGNVINREGTIIFRQNELDSDDEIPAPFGFEKRREKILSMNTEKKMEGEGGEGGEYELDDED